MNPEQIVTILIAKEPESKHAEQTYLNSSDNWSTMDKALEMTNEHAVYRMSQLLRDKHDSTPFFVQKTVMIAPIKLDVKITPQSAIRG